MNKPLLIQLKCIFVETRFCGNSAENERFLEQNNKKEERKRKEERKKGQTEENE